MPDGEGAGRWVYITVTINGNGAVDKPSGDVWYEPGEGGTVTYTAYPSPGWVFDCWSGVTSGTDNPITFLIPEDNAELVANFNPETGPPADTVYESFTETDYPIDIWGQFYVGNNTVPLTDPMGYIWLAEIFTPQVGHTITKVKLPMLRVGPAGLFSISIQTTKDGVAFDSGLPIKIPSGKILSSVEVDGNLISDTTTIWYEYTFAKPCWVEKNIKYAIVIHAEGMDGQIEIWPGFWSGRLLAIGGSNTVPALSIFGSIYPNGYGLYSLSFGETWGTGYWPDGDPVSPDIYWTMAFAEYGHPSYPLTARLALTLNILARRVKT
jgi:hypothetical protein